MEDTLEGVLVVRARVCGVLAKCCNSIGEVRLSRQHRIHEGTESLLIRLGINGRGRELEEVLVCQGRRGNEAGILHTVAVVDAVYNIKSSKF
jgi:hypothetical protein